MKENMSKETYENIIINKDLPIEANHIALGLMELLHPMGLTIQEWTEELIPEMYQSLEEPNWAPWLAAGYESMLGRSQVFPEGQLVILKGETPIASLSMNQVSWDGNTDNLPTWDDVAGDPTTYEQTYDPQGNTLVLMSMNVDPNEQGKQLPAKLVQQAQLLAASLNIDHLIGSFRPSQFGQAKAQFGADLSFWDYATQMKVSKQDPEGVFGSPGEEANLPMDKWLRSLTWLGMNPIKEDITAMVVPVSIIDFEQYKKTYYPESWWQSSENTWECSEVGTWFIEGDLATYKESNLWGELPLITK